MGMGDIVEGIASVGRTILGVEDDDAIQESPFAEPQTNSKTSSGGDKTSAPREYKKLKTRSVGMTLPQHVFQATGIASAARLASKVAEFRASVDHPPMRIIRGKDEVEEKLEQPGPSFTPESESNFEQGRSTTPFVYSYTPDVEQNPENEDFITNITKEKKSSEVNSQIPKHSLMHSMESLKKRMRDSLWHQLQGRNPRMINQKVIESLLSMRRAPREKLWSLSHNRTLKSQMTR